MTSTRFTNIAPYYDRLNTILSLGRDRAWRARLIRTITSSTPLHVLDLCCGTLKCTREILARFPKAHVTSVDLDEAMLAMGERSLTAHERERTTIIHADALRLALPPASVDAIVCAWGFRNIADKETLLQNVQTWLKPNGELLLLDFFRPTSPLSRLLIAIGSRLVPIVGKLLTPDGAAYRYLMRSIREGLTMQEFQSLLARHGLQVDRLQTLSLGSLVLFHARKTQGKST